MSKKVVFERYDMGLMKLTDGAWNGRRMDRVINELWMDVMRPSIRGGWVKGEGWGKMRGRRRRTSHERQTGLTTKLNHEGIIAAPKDKSAIWAKAISSRDSIDCCGRELLQTQVATQSCTTLHKKGKISEALRRCAEMAELFAVIAEKKVQSFLLYNSLFRSNC